MMRDGEWPPTLIEKTEDRSPMRAILPLSVSCAILVLLAIVLALGELP